MELRVSTKETMKYKKRHRWYEKKGQAAAKKISETQNPDATGNQQFNKARMNDEKEGGRRSVMKRSK